MSASCLKSASTAVNLYRNLGSFAHCTQVLNNQTVFPRLPPRICLSSQTRAPKLYFYLRRVMGWMKALGDRKPDHTSSQAEVTTSSGVKNEHGRKTPEVAYIEGISKLSTPDVSSYALIPPSTPNADLPFFSASAIATAVTEDKLYIVIDSIVYDCSTFIHEHPGGYRVLESFRGQDCSWQFWRFHSREVMEKWSWRLRIGRTEVVRNRWAERPRWVGLSRLGDDIANW